ncbi:MAG: agmatine deiminase family protein [Pseudomonadota bacterium]
MRRALRHAPEWAPQRGLLLAWPFAGGDWAPILDDIQREYCALIQTVLNYQSVYLVVQPGCYDAHRQLGQRRGLVYIEAPYNDTWCRDYGPIGLHGEAPITVLDCVFNGWGGRHEAGLDNRVNAHLAQQPQLLDVTFQQSPLELEGGAIDSDGEQHLLVNLHCLRTRWSSLDPAAIEARLTGLLGLQTVLAIDLPPLPGDDTDGHIDTLARFVRPGLLAYQTLGNSRLQCAFEAQLDKLAERHHGPLRHCALPCPDDLDPKLPASYANFVLINGAVLVPQYGSHADAAAIDCFRRWLPERIIEAVDARCLIQQGGGPHCATMQLPPLTANHTPIYEP